MKRAISMILLFLLCLSASTPAWAVDDNTTTQGPCFTVTYTGTPEGFEVPEGDVSFTVELTSKPEGSDEKMITIGTQPSGENTVTVPITLPNNYSKVGVYTYSISQKAGSILGVTYDPDPIVFQVIVGYENEEDTDIGIIATGVGKKLIINDSEVSNEKKTGFENTYSNIGYGTLNVTNTVSGNIGDRQKPFYITVTFTAPENKVIANEITYTVYENNYLVTENTISGGGAKTVAVNISLKSGQTATFSNVPAGVGYVVSQKPESGYTLVYEGDSGTISKGIESNAKVTNSITGGLGTGIYMQRTSYILVLALGIVGLVLLLRGKRKRSSR